MTRYRIASGSAIDFEAKSSMHAIPLRATDIGGELDVEVDGTELDLAWPAHLRLELPVAALHSPNPLNDRELRRRVDANRYPSIAGEAHDVSPGPIPGRYRVRGDLTFHGQTREVAGEIEVTVRGPDSLVVTGEQTFDMRDFGVTPPKVLMMRVDPDVRVRIHIEATRVN